MFKEIVGVHHNMLGNARERSTGSSLALSDDGAGVGTEGDLSTWNQPLVGP